jgi:hypothetical protein
MEKTMKSLDGIKISDLLNTQNDEDHSQWIADLKASNDASSPESIKQIRHIEELRAFGKSLETFRFSDESTNLSSKRGLHSRAQRSKTVSGG